MQRMAKFNSAHGQVLAYPENDFVAEFLNAGWYEFREIAFFYRFLRKGDRVLDIGAHCGLYSSIAKACVGKSGYALAIEPNRTLAPYLGENLGVDGPCQSTDDLVGEGVEWLAAAAMDRPGDVYLSISNAERTAYCDIQTEAAEATVKVPGISVDEIVSRLQSGFDLVKMDVEGVESLVLKGMEETLQSARAPLLMIEFTEANQSRHDSSAEELARSIRQAGYELYRYDEFANELVTADIEPALEHQNLFACRELSRVTARLKGAPTKQSLYADEVVERGRASERLYNQALAFKNFRIRSAGWLEQIEASLNYLRGGEDKSAAGRMSNARELAEAQYQTESASRLAYLIEDGLGQARSMAESLASTVSEERREQNSIRQQFEEAEQFLSTGLPITSRVDDHAAIRAEMEGLGQDQVYLSELRLAAGSLSTELSDWYQSFSARLRKYAAEHLTSRLEVSRIKPLLLVSAEKIRVSSERIVELDSSRREKDAALADLQRDYGQVSKELEQLREEQRAHAAQAEQARLSAEEEKDILSAELDEVVRQLALESKRRRERELEIETVRAEAAREADKLRMTYAADTESLHTQLSQVSRQRDEAREQGTQLLRQLEESQTETEKLIEALVCDHAEEVRELRDSLAQVRDRLRARTEMDTRVMHFMSEISEELSNLAFDARSDQQTIEDLARAVVVSRAAGLMSLMGVGPRRTAEKLLERCSAANARLADVGRKAGTIRSAVAELAEDQIRDQSSNCDRQKDVGWQAYQSASQILDRSRRDAIALSAREDVIAMGSSIIALRRSRILKIATLLGLPAASELNRMFDIYCGVRPMSRGDNPAPSDI